MRFKILFTFALLSLLTVGAVNAQNGMDNVRLFQSFYYDAVITPNTFAEAGLNYNDYEYGSNFNVGAKGAYQINPQIDVTLGLDFVSFSPEEGDGESGLSDLMVVGKYNLMPEDTKVSVGAYVTAPIGEEKVGQGNLNYGAFGAVRHPLDNGMTITANAGLGFYEYEEPGDFEIDPITFEITETEGETKHESFFMLGAGAIYPMNDQMNIVGEFVMKTEFDYMMLSGGVDYLMGNNHLRAALGIGLDDGAPDLAIWGGFLLPLGQ
ncbi:MAG: transporter [candidate division KSB1 bacterium]|jgi:hypothetical protein|nr:transporter [candidate division KSB1 bacterium]